jgi:arylsulfatase A-like enzyme
MKPDSNGAYERFQGKVGETFAQSQPWWPPRRTAPDGAPNIVIVVADDLGYSDIGCYGSEIETPNLDCCAASGLRYANFHATPLCSPTRAALLTGRNSHAAGFAFPTQIDPGFPGYASELPANQPSLAETLQHHGYATMAVGKWHLCKEADYAESGDRHSWPLQRGFDQWYGFLEALTNYHHPHRLIEGNSTVHLDQYPDGYYLTDDLTDRAVRMIREAKTASPAKPIFLYFAHGAVHAPMHAKAPDICYFRGRYDVGWDQLRAERLARQKALGIMPLTAELPDPNSEPGEAVNSWDSLSPEERQLFARYMEIYAAMVRSIDISVGRVRDVLEEVGQLDNTIFIFMSDNGASRLSDSGQQQASPGKVADTGTTSYFGHIARRTNPPGITDELRRMDRIGGPTTWPHYPRGWAMACNTPFRLYKFSTFRGGHQVPFVISWPDRMQEVAGQVRNQYLYVTDVLPTLCEMVGVEPLSARHGKRAHRLHGASFAGTVADPDAASSHQEQYYECVGNRGYYRDGWEAVTVHRPLTRFSDDRWQLFDTRTDVNQRVDLAESHPDLVEELVGAWEKAAWENQVYPLDEGSRLIALWRPPWNDELIKPTRIIPGTPTLERHRSAQLIEARQFRIEVDWHYKRGAQGVLVAHGGQAAGYILFVEDDLLYFEQNEYGEPRALPPIKLAAESQQVSVTVTPSSPGRWRVSVAVDGTVKAEGEDLAQFGGFLPFEGIDVGIDRRSPVSWELHRKHGTFAFSGALHSVTYVPGEPQDGGREYLIEQALKIGLDLQ